MTTFEGRKKKRSACGPLSFERQQAWKNLLPSVLWPFGKAHSVVGMQDISVTLSSCDTVILEDFYLTDRNFVVAGVAHTGWLFLWPLLGYYIYYMVGCVCRQPAQ